MTAMRVYSPKAGLLATLAAATLLAGCATGSPASDHSASGGAESAGADGAASGQSGSAEDKNVTLVVHDSFPADEFAAAASEATGYNVEVIAAGDGGELSSQLVLTKGAPLADAFFGVDNAFASRLIENEVTAPFTPADPLPGSAAQLAAELSPEDASGEYAMVPIDQGATCMNIDPAWFAAKDIPEPVTYEDLAAEEYRGLTVLIDPTSSSTGASFLTGTVAEFGEDGFADYWQRLSANEPRLVQSWDEAYYTQFTGAEGGTYPIVLSYSSSPAYTVNEAGTSSSTKALLETCSSQIEYAGILEGAANPAGAAAVVDYLLSPDFQSTIPETMYMYPIDPAAELPREWAEFAPLPTSPHDLPAPVIGADFESWLKTFSDATGW